MNNYTLQGDWINPEVELPETAYPPAIPDREQHDKLLQYITQRLDTGKSQRDDRILRMGKIDKLISTWQVLTKSDSARASKQEATGQAQAISVNLPLVHTHLDDMVSFFAGVYSPQSGDFFQLPDEVMKEEGQALVDRLNNDAKRTQHYSELCKFLRSILKYNVAGLHVQWVSPDGMTLDDPKTGLNQSTSLDMYNVMWDPVIRDPSKIRCDAQWASVSELRNRQWFIRREVDGMYYGVGSVIGDDSRPVGNNGNLSAYYVYPPDRIQIRQSDSKSRDNGIDWDQWFEGTSAGTAVISECDAFELTTVYIWLNPSQFKLRNTSQDVEAAFEGGQLMLWKAQIMGNQRIISLEPETSQVVEGTEVATADNMIQTAEIPIHMSYLNEDDLKQFQRSVAEMLSQFQNYGSFLMNAHIVNTRQNIFGTRVYDPSMFDGKQLGTNGEPVDLESKMPGRDVRSGMTQIGGTGDTSRTMEHLSSLMSIVQQFFPAQALPSQVAGIDRAVSSQVAAVLNGVNRRLHMLVRHMDDEVMIHNRIRQFRNLAKHGSIENLAITDDKVYKILGSGLAQLNREAAAQAFNQLLFAVLQNQEAMQTFDIPKMFDFWARLQNIGTGMSGFVKQQPAQSGAVPGQMPSQTPPVQ